MSREWECKHLPCSHRQLQMSHLLHTLKTEQPRYFQEALRVSPLTFDYIINHIQNDPVFTNNSNNAQMPVPEQVAITLYHSGHDGNAASLQAIAGWAGTGKGTVNLVCQHVMVAVLHSDFIDKAVWLPTEMEKEVAKKWVEEHSCRGWHDGWCLVDGTLIPLYEHPHWYGESYFDRKCNYSLNLQIWFSFLIDLPVSYCVCRLFLFPISISLTSVMDKLGVHMMQLLGKIHGL